MVEVVLGDGGGGKKGRGKEGVFFFLTLYCKNEGEKRVYI